MAATDYQKTANLIAQFEGFEPVAKWDVNADRLGFGSDTEGPEQRPVVKGMTTTRARALQNLALRIPQYERTVVGQVTEPSWDMLGVSSKCALLDMAYNYGSLPGNVCYAVRNQLGIHAISIAIEAHEEDNRGINAHRRKVEAVMVATDEEHPSPQPAPTPAPGHKITTIRDVQEALNELLPPWVGRGYVPLTVDGIPGPRTRDYIIDFQRLTGLVPDGIAGERTIATLEADLASEHG